MAFTRAYRRPITQEVVARPRKRRWRVAGALGVAVLAGGLVGGAYAYDATRSQVIAPGIRVGHLELGGLTAAEARGTLAKTYRPLLRPILVRSGSRRFVLHPRQVGLVVDFDEAVSQALARSRRGWFLSRTVRQIAGRELDAALRPHVTFSGIAVARFARGVEAAVERPPRAARVVPEASGLIVQGAIDGLDVDIAGLRRQIERTLTGLGGPRRLRVAARRIPPRVTVADLARRYPAYLTVDRTRFQLRLYERLRLVRTYTIAVGAIGYDTPAGVYRIQSKAVNPTWSVPRSPWTGSLAGAVIPPGPSNPLKARWLGIDGSVGIHGTDQDWSLGSAASHGCIRMAIADVIELYERVAVGAPVYIG